MNKRCIINVATGEFYLNKQARLLGSFCESVQKVYMNKDWGTVETIREKIWASNLTGIDLILFNGYFPEGSRTHQDSPYGFKLHAMDFAFRSGYTSLLWLDAPAYPVKEDPSPIFEKMEKEGYYVMSHVDPLHNCVGDEALAKFQVTREQLKAEGLNLPSGSCYGFDLTNHKGRTLFENMLMHEKEGLFFSKDGRHRHDEAILALNMRNYKFPVFFNDPLFQSDSDECVIKSGDGQPE